MQTIQHADEAPDRCPECDEDEWSTVKFVIHGDEGRMCMRCGRIERRCTTGHWTPCETVLDEHGFCPTCQVRQKNYASGA